MAKRVLAFGIEPGNADYSAFPQLTPELVRHHIEAQLLRLRDLGYEVTSCLIDLDATRKPVSRPHCATSASTAS